MKFNSFFQLNIPNKAVVANLPGLGQARIKIAVQTHLDKSVVNHPHRVVGQLDLDRVESGNTQFIGISRDSKDFFG